MNKRILLTLVHDFIIFVFSFFSALWIRLDFDIAISLVKNLWLFSIFFSISNLLILKYFGLYLGIWRYASLHEIFSIIKSLAISTLILVSLLFLIFRLENVPRSFPVLLFIVSLFGVTAPRIFYRLLKDKISKNNVPIIPVYLSGKIESVENYIRMTNSEKNSPYNVIGILEKK
jgi:Predicted nucleoside-diphosphate sugar epimerases